jgi:glycosyltransferase involved in cell wall biosynthesis/SAM-dependent methyltransferase
MQFVFICPGMPFNGDFIQRGQSLGGSETACYYVAREVARLGHRVLLFTNQRDAGGKHDGVDYAWAGPQSEAFPAGEYAQSFASATPTDVLVVQRATGLFAAPHAASVAFWWLHDLALVRAGQAARVDLFQYDGVLAVSEWHRSQIAEVWNLPVDRIGVVRNAVDGALYTGEGQPPRRGLRLLYQSRFERGIDYLVRPGGIMDRLADRRPDAILTICGYDNQPDHTRGYYEGVMARVKKMPNARVIGHLGKVELARLQESHDLMVYPSTFEETSCISAIEAQCAGLPFLGSAVGALSETCGDEGGARLLPLIEGRADEDAFVEFLAGVDGETLSVMRDGQLAAAGRVSWEASAQELVRLATEAMEHRRSNMFSMMRTMLDRSDTMLARQFARTVSSTPDVHGCLPEIAELDAAYSFVKDPAAHYDSDEAVADIERGGLDVTQSLRFMETSRQIMKGRPSNLLDYGCQKGHYLWSLVMGSERTGLRYTGIDVSPRVIDWARKNCRPVGAEIRFEVGDVMQPDFDYNKYGKFDALLLGEVLEHVESPELLMQRLAPLLMDGCHVVITTPYGDWEGKDYARNPRAPRYHLHHFERADMEDLFGGQEEFLVVAVPAGRSDRSPLGSLVTSFVYRETAGIVKSLDWYRKMSVMVPRQTLSYCAIVRNAEHVILRSLMSVNLVADEFIVALDKSTTDGTRAILERFHDQHAGYRRFEIIDAESPLNIGFDEARNRTVDLARGDWVLWLDADEELTHAERAFRYLRGSVFDGYGVAQHHMSADPVGVLTTDWPVRIFRRAPYLRFSGVVHEHPDDTERPNSGPRAPAQVIDVNIMHHGYTTEEVRRSRFQRNLPLIRRDRAQNPRRLLGKMLWLRDLAHVCMFGLEQTRGMVTEEMLATAKEGIELWEDLLRESEKSQMAARMLRDGLEFYSTLVGVLGSGFEFQVQMHAARDAPAKLDAGQKRMGRFLNREHLNGYLRTCVDEQVQPIVSRYF